MKCKIIPYLCFIINHLKQYITMKPFNVWYEFTEKGKIYTKYTIQYGRTPDEASAKAAPKIAKNFPNGKITKVEKSDVFYI